MDVKTPYEAWHSEKQRVKHLRVLGCNAYAHILKNEHGKLDSKARKCILVGYGQETKGYRLYDPIRQKVLHSRDVRFNEEEKQGSDTLKDDEVRHVVLELPCNPDPKSPDTPGDSAPEPTVRRSTRETSTSPFWYAEQQLNISK